jgi:hypothetical protein
MTDSASGLKLISLKLTGVRLYAFILILIGLILITIETIWSYWDFVGTWSTWPPDYIHFLVSSIIQMTGIYIVFVAIFCFSFIILNIMERELPEGTRQLTSYEGEKIYRDYRQSTIGAGLTRLSWITVTLLVIGFTLMVSMMLYSYLDALNRISPVDIEFQVRFIVNLLYFASYFSGISILVYLLLKERGKKRPIIDDE